jgi:phospholipid transport system substrate-binding protein
MKKRANGWKAFDIYIEGVSMIMNYRGTFAAQIQESGIDGLIKSLSDKNIASNKAAREAEGK